MSYYRSTERQEHSVNPPTVGRKYWQRLRRLKGGDNLIAIVDQGIVSAVNVATSVIVGRSSGTGELGKYALGFSILLLVSAVLDALVIGPYILRVHKLQHRAARYAGSMLLHACGLAIVTSIAFSAAGSISMRFNLTRDVAQMFLPTAVVIAPILMRDVARRLAFANNQPAIALALDACVAVIQVTGLLIIAFAGTLTSTGALALSGLACLIGASIYFGLRWREFEFAWSDALRDLVGNIGLGKWLLASQCTMVAQFTSVQWTTALILGTAQTGVLTACLSVVMAANPFLTGIGNLLLPRASSTYAREGGVGLARVVYETAAVIGVGMATFLFGIVVAGSQVLHLMYGGLDPQTQHILVILATGLALRGVGMAAYLGLWVTGDAKSNVFTNLLGLGTAVVTAVWFAFHFGLIGVAYGMLAGESCATAVRWILLRRSLIHTIAVDYTNVNGDLGPQLQNR